MALRHRDTFNEINITPLTDIFLVLLIIMMVVAPLLDQQGLNLSVPEMVEKTEQLKDSKLLNVIVTNDGKYLVDGEIVTKENLLFTIQDKSKEMKDGLLIQTEPEALHGEVVTLMDTARNAGVLNISISEIN